MGNNNKHDSSNQSCDYGNSEGLIPEVMTIDDIATVFKCGKTKAYERMREIKDVSDITHNNRTIHRIDYDNWRRFYERDKTTRI